MLKKLLYGAACALCVCWAQAQTTPQTVHMKGQLRGMGTTSVPMVYGGASSMLGNSRTTYIPTDKEGNFDITLPITEPGYYEICRNTLWLTPGDDLSVLIPQNSDQATFEGRGAEANRYMRFRRFPASGSFICGGRNCRASLPAMQVLIDSLAQARRAELAALTGVSDVFKRQEEARITGDMLISYILYPVYYKMRHRADSVENQKRFAHYVEEVAPLARPLLATLCDDAFLDVRVVRDVFQYTWNEEYASWWGGMQPGPRAQELLQAEEQAQKLDLKAEAATIDSVAAYAATLHDASFRAELEQKVASATKLLKGSPAFDIELTDTEGRPHRLSEWKGQLIYVDLWATWCGPCCAEAPYFEKLSQAFVGKNIRFVPISTDTSRRAWLGYLEKNPKSLAQYNTVDKTYSKQWKVKFIPRYILIDKDFRILDAYAPYPSDPQTKALLESLLQ